MEQMDSLETFTEEMLSSAKGERFLQTLLQNLEVRPIPSLEKTLCGYDFISNLHGIRFDYEQKEVSIAYRVIEHMYPDRVVTFALFEAILEGILCCRRKRKW